MSILTHATAKSCTREIADSIRERMQSDIYRLAEPDTRTADEKRFPCPTTFEVLRDWEFVPNEWHCQDTADGQPVERSMKITDPKDRTSTFFVTYRFRTTEWTCDCPSHRHHFAQTMILAVMARVLGHPLAQMAKEATA